MVWLSARWESNSRGLATTDRLAVVDRTVKKRRMPRGAGRGLVALRDTPDRTVEADHRGEHVGLGQGGTVFGLELGPLGVEQRQEVGDALAVADAGDRRGAGALADLVGQGDEALLLLPVGDERVLGLFERQQDGLVVLGQRLAGRGPGAAEAGPGAPDVEGAPLQRRR